MVYQRGVNNDPPLNSVSGSNWEKKPEITMAPQEIGILEKLTQIVAPQKKGANNGTPDSLSGSHCSEILGTDATTFLVRSFQSRSISLSRPNSRFFFPAVGHAPEVQRNFLFWFRPPSAVRKFCYFVPV